LREANSSMASRHACPSIRRSSVGSALRVSPRWCALAIWHPIFIEGHVPSRDEEPLAWIA
jgi:hypothetical protein